MIQQQASRRRHDGRDGFTIVELLIVIAVIIVLLSILIVAVRAASRTAQGANTQALFGAINQGLVRFQEDHGYLPPVLDKDRNLYEPDWDAVIANGNYPFEAQEYYSVTTLADYLVGYGPSGDDGFDGPGIRSPGSDGVWGASTNNQAAGFLIDREPTESGKVYAAYIELKDENLLASTDGTNTPSGVPNVYRPGQGGYNPDDPKVILDYWGSPIRYYRQLYRPGALAYPYKPYNPAVRPPSLADVFILRPQEFKNGAAINGLPDNNDWSVPGGDISTSMALKTASFALFSPGPDRRSNGTMRIDQDGFNRDNLVESAR